MVESQTRLNLNLFFEQLSSCLPTHSEPPCLKPVKCGPHRCVDEMGPAM